MLRYIRVILPTTSSQVIWRACSYPICHFSFLFSPLFQHRHLHASKISTNRIFSPLFFPPLAMLFSFPLLFFKDLVKLFEETGKSSSGNNSPRRFSKLFRGNKRRGWLTLSWYNFPKKYLHGDELQFNDEVGNNFHYDASSCNFIVGIISSLSSEIGFKTNLYKYLYSTNVSTIIFNKGEYLNWWIQPEEIGLDRFPKLFEGEGDYPWERDSYISLSIKSKYPRLKYISGRVSAPHYVMLRRAQQYSHIGRI